MPEWLSAEWAEQAAGLCHLLPEAAGANGTVSVAFTVAPRKEVGFHWSYENGKAVSGAAGPVPAADLVLGLAATDAADVLSGRVEPSVAFMRGRLKASGDGGLLLALLESTTAASFADWRSAMAGLGPLP